MENGDIIVIDNVRELLDNQLEVIDRVITDKAGNEIKIKKGAAAFHRSIRHYAKKKAAR